MTNIVLSADSTCDLPQELKEKFSVEYFPYHIIFREKDYRDNVDIFPHNIFNGFYEDGSLPKTAASSPGIYEEYFKQFTSKGAEVIHFSLASTLTSGCQNATLAAQSLEGVYVIDSQSLSTGIGLQVVTAAKLIEQGKSAKEIYENALHVRKCAHASFVLDNLDFMAAGGRCPSIVNHLGKALNFKPSIQVHNNDGSMSVGKLYRGILSKCNKKYITDTIAKYNDIVLDYVFVTYTEGFDEETIKEYTDMVQELLPNAKIYTTDASCTISSHCGPKCMGVLFLTESECA